MCVCAHFLDATAEQRSMPSAFGLRLYERSESQRYLGALPRGALLFAHDGLTKDSFCVVFRCSLT